MELLHPRSGELVAIAKQDRWFSYYYWIDDDRAPEFARTVDIHRKPGYDPVELFVDPRLSLVPARALFTLVKKKLGFRYLMRLTPLNSSLVLGSHGRLTDRLDQGPVFLTSEPHLAPPEVDHACDIKGLVLSHLTVG